MESTASVKPDALNKSAYKRRVRNILIHKPMQREFTFVLIALLMISSLAIGFVIHETIRQAAFGGGFQFGKINPYEVLAEVRYLLIVRVTGILFVTLITIGVFALLFLHRVAGPVYRFRQVFRKLHRGEIPHPIQLREGDFFMEAAEDINHLIGKINKDKSKLESAKVKVDSLAQEASNSSMAPTVKEIQKILSQN